MAKKFTSFSERLQYLMEVEGINKIALERKAGLYNGQAGVFLSGKTEPGLKSLQKLINHFKGVSVEWLVLGTGKAFSFILTTVLLSACSNSQTSTNEQMQVEQESATPVAEPLLISDQGLRVITQYYYHPQLGEKKLRPKNYLITRDTIVVNGKEDSWRYNVVEIKADSATVFSVKMKGGHTSLDKTAREFELTIRGGVIQTKRLDTGGTWYDVQNDLTIVQSFEKELDKAGFIFHR